MQLFATFVKNKCNFFQIFSATKTCPSHDSNASDTSFVASYHQAGLTVSVGDFVIVNYESSNFPGKVTEVDEERAKCPP